MAKYDKETKFYWLQLKEDFFENDAIEWLEEQQPNGRDYAYFYLKLCLKSLKSNGILIRNVGNILIPYDNKKLAELTKMDFDTVTVAMQLLKQIGLIKVLDNGEIYMTQLENLIGSQSSGAFKKQQQRLIRGQGVDNCPPKIKIELKKEIEIEQEDIYTYIEKNFNRILSPIEYEQVSQWKDTELTRYAIKQAVLNGKYNLKYINAILVSWEKNHITTVQEAQQETNDFKNTINKEQKLLKQYENVKESIVSENEEQEFLKKVKEARGN